MEVIELPDPDDNCYSVIIVFSLQEYFENIEAVLQLKRNISYTETWKIHKQINILS